MKQPQKDHQRLLISVEEAAEILGIGRTAAYELVRTKQVKSVKLGRSRRVVLSSLNEFIMQQLQEE